ncbi:hypothetical protein, partial [Helicobacter pylori]|uniref:hypothetical protein n=1 Tax=Helicobacter pylori TaxID=210 RepID=UPI0009A2DA13
MQHSKSSFFQKRGRNGILSFYHSIILSFYHSIILSFYHSIIQATLPYFYNYLSFYKNLFKNPLFFIIPPFINPFINPFIPLFINPHHIFQPFDSISPIFKPVGLTELN